MGSKDEVLKKMDQLGVVAIEGGGSIGVEAAEHLLNVISGLDAGMDANSDAAEIMRYHERNRLATLEEIDA